MDLISRKALLAAYDERHKGPPGGARELIEDAPSVPAVPLDKLCKWLAVCTDDPPCISLRFYDCGKVCREKKPSDAECWKTVITKWMEGLDAK